MKRNNSTNLSIESLERREMMAADATLFNGTLNVQGTDNDDLIEISPIAVRDQNGRVTGEQLIRVTITDSATGSELLMREFNANSVNQIVAHGLGGNDAITNVTSKNSHMYGDAGSDALQGGTGADALYGGSGSPDRSDTLSDVNHLYGGGGVDALIGSAAKDYIFGGAGDDWLMATPVVMNSLATEATTTCLAVVAEKIPYAAVSATMNWSPTQTLPMTTPGSMADQATTG